MAEVDWTSSRFDEIFGGVTKKRRPGGLGGLGGGGVAGAGTGAGAGAGGRAGAGWGGAGEDTMRGWSHYSAGTSSLLGPAMSSITASVSATHSQTAPRVPQGAGGGGHAVGMTLTGALDAGSAEGVLVVLMPRPCLAPASSGRWRLQPPQLSPPSRFLPPISLPVPLASRSRYHGSLEVADICGACARPCSQRLGFGHPLE